MNAKTGKNWKPERINDLNAIDAFSKTQAHDLIMGFIEKRVSKEDKLSAIKDMSRFEEEAMVRRAKVEAYNDVKNFVEQMKQEYNIYQKVKEKETKNG